MSEALPMHEEVADALRQMTSEGLAGTNHNSRARARQAMIAAVAARRERRWVTGFLGWPLRPRSLVIELAVLTVAAMGLIGWSAPAGTPFHGVRSARETVARSLSGENRLDLDLNIAEKYLAEARHNQSPQDSEAEASLVLEDARGLLPTDETDPAWQRWRADENALAALLAPPPAPVVIHASPTRRPTPAPKPSESAKPGDDGRDSCERGSPAASPGSSPQAFSQLSPTPCPDR